MLDITGQTRWGIIGDGQLARMLALSAIPLGVRPIILTGDSSSPAGQVSPLFVRGHIDSREDLHALLSQVDGAIIESEFINCDVLESTGLANKVVPSMAVIRVLQNKLEQKKLLQRLNIPSSPLYDQGTGETLEWFSTISANGTRPVVLKFATFGYDGKGVLVLNGAGPSDLEAAAEFLALAAKRKISIYAEDRIAFDKELAMVAVRRRDGEFKTWPLVISEQKHGICDRVTGPATALGVSPAFSQASTNCLTCILVSAEFSSVTGEATALPASGFPATADLLSSHSDLDHRLRQIPNRIDALRRKSPMSSLSKSGLSARTEPTPNIDLPNTVRLPHIVAIPFASVIAGLPLFQPHGSHDHIASTSIRIRVISACPTKSN